MRPVRSSRRCPTKPTRSTDAKPGQSRFSALRDAAGKNRDSPGFGLDCALAVFPVRIAKLALEQLAIRIARHLANEIERARAFVLGELLATEVRELFGQRRTGLDACCRLDRSLYLFAPILVRNAEY